MPITTISTSQAPDAKPVGVSKTVSNNGSAWTVLIEVPQYEVPEQVFGGSVIIVPGSAEITSPLLVTNTTSSTARISVRVYREIDSNYYTLANLIPIPANDIVTLPLNGQFLITGDMLEVLSDTLDALDVTLSYTVGQPEQDDIT